MIVFTGTVIDDVIARSSALWQVVGGCAWWLVCPYAYRSLLSICADVSLFHSHVYLIAGLTGMIQPDYTLLWKQSNRRLGGSSIVFVSLWCM